MTKGVFARIKQYFFMGIEEPKLKRELNDWDYAREVRALKKKKNPLTKENYTYHEACDSVLDELEIFDVKARIAWKSRIGKICGEISGRARKKYEEEEIKEQPKPTESLYDQRQGEGVG